MLLKPQHDSEPLNRDQTNDQKRDVAAFTRLTEPHHRQLFGIALSLCRDRDQAADLTQEALIRAYQAFDRFRPGAPVLPWLRRILRNVFLDTFKTGRARHEVTESTMGSAEHEPYQLDTTHAHDGVSALDQLERNQLVTWLQQEIAALDPSQQQVLELCVMQDLSFKEAAELLELPVGTVASRLARARAELRLRILKQISAARRRGEKVGDSILMDLDAALTRKPSEAASDRRSKGRGKQGP